MAHEIREGIRIKGCVLSREELNARPPSPKPNKRVAMTNTIPRQSAIDAIASLKFNDARALASEVLEHHGFDTTPPHQNAPHMKANRSKAMTEPNPADMTARQIANQVCENWEIAAFTQEWAIARDAAIAALQQSRSAVIEECAAALEVDAQLCDCAAHSEGECACGAWCEWKTITSARAVEIVRALSQESADA